MSATASFTVPTPRGPEDVAVSYARVGRGEPLVLLHGIGHHRQAWDPVVDILATEREVIAVDLPGFGASPALPPALAYDLLTTNAVLGALFETLELPEDEDIDSSTVNGLVQEKTCHLPKVGDHFTLGEYDGVVTRTARRRVTEVRLTPAEPVAAEEKDDEKEKRFPRLSARENR